MNTLRLPVILLLSLLLFGCTSIIERPKAPLTYRIAPEVKIQPVRAAPLPLTLQIRRPQAAAGLDTEQIAYRQHPLRTDYYSQSRWAAPPAKMLAEELARALEDAGLYQTVLGPDSHLPADLHLYLELVELAHIIKDSSASQGSEVQLALRFKLVDAHQSRVIASGSLRLSRPAFSLDALGAVEAANEAAAEAIRQVIRFCEQHVPTDCDYVGAALGPRYKPSVGAGLVPAHD